MKPGIVRLIAAVLACFGCQGCGIVEPPLGDPPAEVRVQLGRRLFHDTRLSINEKRSCGICHEQALGFTDGFPRAVGATNALLQRTTPTLTNVARREVLLWAPPADAADPAALDLHAQVSRPLFSRAPVEMGMGGDNQALLLQRLALDSDYPSLFERAFPDQQQPLDLDNLASAIVAFEQTLISDGNDHDRHLRGEPEALSSAALRGLALFRSPELKCARCHGGPDLDSVADEDGEVIERHGFFNTGLYNVDGAGGYPAHDLGLHESTAEQRDMGRFRTPTLRNVAVTAPYTHDGSVASLQDMVRHYAAGGRNNTSGPNVGDGRANPFKDPLLTGFSITASQTEDLVAFLNSLTDQAFLEDPRFSNPFLE